MKKALSTMVALALAAGISGTAMAADSAGSFSDIPKDHWSYAAVDQLVKDGIIEGYGNGTFAGDRPMSRYEMAAIVARATAKLQAANPADQALIEKLENEYGSELKKLDDKYNDLDKRVDNVMLSGFVRAKYDNDATDHVGNDNNKHFYMDLEGKMKVGKDWDAHFQSETRKGYTSNQSWRNNSKSDDQDGTFQRVWVEGHAGTVGVKVGTAWWGYGFQNVPFGHAADGAQVDYNLSKDWNVKAFTLRPRQGDLVTMPAGQDTNIYGVNFTGKLGKNLETSLTWAGNKNHNDDQKMSSMGAFELRTKLGENFQLTGTYVKTNADSYNASKEYRLDYKGTDLKKVGSFGAYFRYIDFGRYGDMSHDDEWGSLPTDVKGWILGVKYVPYANIEWETFYSKQTRNYSGTDSSMSTGASRNLFRTQVDFHF